LLNTTASASALRAGDWKLIVRVPAEPPSGQGRRGKRAQRRSQEETELFNLSDDPYEQKNIAAEQPAKVAELRAQLDRFAEEAVPPPAMPKPASYKAPAIWGDFGG